ncbi:hypothetical protein [Streptomyces sp. NPDC057363]|uniref:hypothetical protein n=1 Tax=Streptomyces sp. NPDC057363 TaxID=3346107 RepID=UPI00363F2D32
MGVFARLFRKSKSAQEAPAAETPADAPEPERAVEESTAEAAETADAGPRSTVQPAEATDAADSESVGIPKQQSAGEAVDNEADKGART